MGGATSSMLYSGATEAFAGALVGSAVSSVVSSYEMQEGVDVTLFHLQQELFKIQSAINEARRRRITNQQLLKWMASLIDAHYCGNYYHRTFKSRNSHPRMIASEGTSTLAISPSYRAAKRLRRMKTLLFGDEELSNLNDELKKLRSIDICTFLLMVNAQPERPFKVYLYMEPNRLLNRDKEKEQVMNFLFEHSTAGENNVDVLPIVGPSGVGKTTLSLNCFHDPKVQYNFSLKFYIPNLLFRCDYGDLTIFRIILGQCGCSADITNNCDENTLKAMLKQSLSSERFLLVMDNFCNVDFTIWNALWECLRCGKKGSKVILIIPLRHYNDCMIKNLGTVKPIMMLDYFSEDDYMKFFKEHAFGSADPDDHPELEKLGREMVTKTYGSLWAAKIFGEILRDNLDPSFWSNLLQNVDESRIKSDWENFGLIIVESIIFRFLRKDLPELQRGTIKQLEKESLVRREIKSFRELMALDPQQRTTLNKKGEICLNYFLTKHVFLDKCIVTTNKHIFYSE